MAVQTAAVSVRHGKTGVQTGGGPVGGRQKESFLSYVKKHWALYVIFLAPALVLTIIFRYIPMGGILIAFEKFNPIKGIFGSEWVGFHYFARFLNSPDFMRYLVNTLKLSRSEERRVGKECRSRWSPYH